MLIVRLVSRIKPSIKRIKKYVKTDVFKAARKIFKESITTSNISRIWVLLKIRYVNNMLLKDMAMENDSANPQTGSFNIMVKYVDKMAFNNMEKAVTKKGVFVSKAA